MLHISTRSKVSLLLLLLGALGPAWAQSPATKTSFEFEIETEPPSWVYRMSTDGELHYLGLSGKKLLVSASPAELEGRKALDFRFYAPPWNLDPKEAHRLPENMDAFHSRAVEQKISGRDLKQYGRWPQVGAHTLALPFSVRAESWLRAYPLKGLTLLLLPILLLVAWVKRGVLLSYLVPTPTQEQSPAQDYVLDPQPLGRGGMGEVYAARSVQGERVAIKFLLPGLGEDPEFRKRFEREIRVGIEMKHPNLLRFDSFGVATDGRLYVVTELLEGQTLKMELSRGLEDPPQMAYELLEQVGRALEFLHGRGVTHRDIKPDNIFCCSDGTLKLLDLGLVSGQDMTAITKTGHVLGTPAYMAPEQALGDETQAASDQYSLGFVLYEVLTGSKAFSQNNEHHAMFQHLKAKPESMREKEPRISEALENAVLKMLEKTPEERFENLAAARDELLPHLEFVSWRGRGGEESPENEETVAGTLRSLPESLDETS